MERKVYFLIGGVVWGAVRKVGDGAFRGIGGSWVCLVFAHTNRFYWPDKVRF